MTGVAKRKNDRTKGCTENMKKTTRNDLILIGVLLAAALFVYAGMRIWQEKSTQQGVAVVTVDGEIYGTYPLDEDVTVKILPEGENAKASYNMLVIRDGEAQVTEASCPDGICVAHRAISKNKESIVCLPNKVIVRIENGKEAEVDAETH